MPIAEKQIPWEGDRFPSTGLLLVGESAYDWIDENGTRRKPAADHPNLIVRDVCESFDGAGGFLKKVTRALAGVENPDSAARWQAWQHCDFFNFLGSFDGLGAKSRPTADQFRAAQPSFLDLMNYVKPKRTVIFGETAWSYMPPTDLFIHDDLQAYRLQNGELAWCLCVPHPTSRKNPWTWQTLAESMRLFVAALFPREDVPHGSGFSTTR